VSQAELRLQKYFSDNRGLVKKTYSYHFSSFDFVVVGLVVAICDFLDVVAPCMRKFSVSKECQSLLFVSSCVSYNTNPKSHRRIESLR
jgi:hypothetical protein